MENQLTTKDFFARDDVRSKFMEILGKRSTAYISSVLSVVNSNNLLQKAEPASIYMAAMMAAVLDLPINQNLGNAYIVPYGNKAQFQLGYKGFIQLALRSGQFKTIGSKAVYEGQLEIDDSGFEGYSFRWSNKLSEKVIGYVAYFKLLNGFEKSLYMSIEEVTKHGKKYSKSFNNGPWKTDFDSMATKTVLKLLLDKYAPKSIEMQKAQIVDQAVINDVDTLDVDYIDNGSAPIDYESMKRTIENDLIENEYKFQKGELERINEIIDNEETQSYSTAIKLMSQRIVTVIEND